MHPFELQTKVNHDLVIGYYVLAKEIRWQGKEQTVTVFKKGSATKKQLKVLKGALWVEDNFAQNEESLVYMARNSGGSDYVEGNVYGIISSEFFHRVVSNKNPQGDLERLKELFALPKGLCKLAMAYVTGERKAYDMETITENAANSIFVGSFKGNFILELIVDFCPNLNSCIYSLIKDFMFSKCISSSFAKSFESTI